MHQITIRLPCNRDYAGTLKLEDAKGKVIAGPFKICARVHDELARANGNPDRLPVLPFGDMPLGEYQITQIVPSGPGTAYDGDEFGSAGIVFLQPRHGEAVLADANGRFIFLIQGGALSRNGALRPTQDGSLRLSNRDQRKLVSVLRRVGAGACRCIVTNSGSAKHRVAAARSGPLPAGAAAAGLAETSRRSWLRTMLIAAGAFASVPSLLFSPPKAYGEGGGTDYSPKQDLDKYQDQLKQAQDAAAQAQADYEKERQTNPNANMAPMLDAQGKVQGLQDMVRYESQQAAQQPPPATTTEPANENPANTGPTTTEPNNENPGNTTPTVSEPTYENPQSTTTTTTEPTNENPTTTTGTETTNENPQNTTTTTGTETTNENPANTTPTTTETESVNENPATTTTTTETNNENPPNSQTMTVSEPTYNNGSDTQAQPNSAQPGTETDMRDAVKDSQSNPNQAQQGQITPFSNPAQPTIDQTPVQMPKGGQDKLATDQVHAIELNPDVNTKQTQFGWDTAGNKNANNFSVPVSTPQASPVGTEPPLVIPDSMKNNPDVLQLNQAQQQLNDAQVTAAQAEANYKATVKTNPNADMGPMIDAQAKFKGQQNFVKMLTDKVTAQLPRLPTVAAPKVSAGSAGPQSQPATGP